MNYSFGSWSSRTIPLAVFVFSLLFNCGVVLAIEHTEEPGVTEVVPGERAGIERHRLSYRVDGDDLVDDGGLLWSASRLPGISFQQTNVGAGSPLIRGRVGIENALRIDGLRYGNQAFRTGPNQYLNVLMGSSFSSMSVQVGPSGTAYGGGATGGVVRLRTLDSFVMQRGRAGVRLSSADLSTEGYADAHWREDRAWLHVGAAMASHGERTIGGGSSIPGTDFQRKSLRLGFGTPVFGGTPWVLDGRVLYHSVEDASRFDRLGAGRARSYTNGDLFGYMRLSGYFGELSHRLDWAVMTQRTDEYVNRWKCDVNRPDYRRKECALQNSRQLHSLSENHDEVWTVGSRLSTAWFLLDEKWDLEVGAEIYRDTISISTQRDYSFTDLNYGASRMGTFVPDTSGVDWGVFAVNEFAVADWDGAGVALIAGGRINGLHTRLPESARFEETAFDAVTGAGELGVTLEGADGSGLHVVASTGYRQPNFQELTSLGDSGTFFEIPNTGLGPEQVFGVEIGAELKGRYGELGGALYGTRITDSIERVSTLFNGSSTVDGQEVRQNQNIGDSRIFGGEVWGESARFGPVGLFGNFSVVRKEVDLAEGTEPGRREPPMGGRVGIIGGSEQGTLRVYTDFALQQTRLSSGDRSDLRICENPRRPGDLLDDCDGTPGWMTLNMEGEWKVSSVWKWTVFARNLTDAHYRPHGSGLEGPGIHLGTVLRAEF